MARRALPHVGVGVVELLMCFGVVGRFVLVGVVVVWCLFVGGVVVECIVVVVIVVVVAVVVSYVFVY